MTRPDYRNNPIAFIRDFLPTGAGAGVPNFQRDIIEPMLSSGLPRVLLPARPPIRNDADDVAAFRRLFTRGLEP